MLNTSGELSMEAGPGTAIGDKGVMLSSACIAWDMSPSKKHYGLQPHCEARTTIFREHQWRTEVLGICLKLVFSQCARARMSETP